MANLPHANGACAVRNSASPGGKVSPLKAVSRNAKSAYCISTIRPIADARKRFSFEELCDGYMAGYNGRDRTRHQVLKRACAYFDGWIASEIDADAIADALEDVANTPIRRYVGLGDDGAAIYRELNLPAPGTINKFKATISAVFTWAQKKRLMPKGWRNPCREVPGLPLDNERVRFLSDDERNRLLKVARLSSWPRLYLLVLTALTTGARRSELLSLRYSDLDLHEGTAYVRTSKNNEPRVLPLTSAVVEEIGRHGRPPHQQALLFPRIGNPDRPFTIDRAWQVAMRDARVEDFRFHDLRHSCASYLAQSGASLLDIAAVLGHKQLDVTRRYAHLTVNTKRALVGRVLGDIS